VRLYPRAEEPGVKACYEGWDGVLEYLVNWFGGWQEYEVEPVRYLEAGGHVLVDMREVGIASGSAIRVEETFAHAFEVDAGKIVAWRMYGPMEEALQAVDSAAVAVGSGISFPGESSEYRSERERLLEAEIDLRRAIERVAAQRRALPPGGPVPQDYVFEEAAQGGGEVRFSELFAPGKDTLVIYSFMFPRSSGDTRPGPALGETAQLPLAETPCPSCTSILDSLDGASRHLAQRLNLVVVAKSAPERIRAYARERGWHHLRLLSSRTNTYNRDYHAERPDGEQIPILNVFARDGDTIRHAWATELMFAPRAEGEDPRHVDAIWPVWNVLDLTPGGRGDAPDFPGEDY
jgi:predicted dithiol-disulfide oxidoreductase (DUF899 family)